jgi:hypothetical protein
MTEARDEANLVRRAAKFGRAATIAGIIVFVLALAQVYTSFSIAMERARQNTNPQAATPAASLVLLDKMLYSSLASAFVIFGAGVLAMAAARAASSGTAPEWAGPQDEAFVRTATRFAKVTEVVAWVYLVVNAAIFVYASYNRIAQMADSKEAPVGSLSRAMIAAGYLGTSTLVAMLRLFFVFLLGALLIRTLLVISRKSAPTQAEGRAAAQGNHNA